VTELERLLDELKAMRPNAANEQLDGNDWREREAEYLRMLDEKTDLIRTLHEFIGELQVKIARLETELCKFREPQRPG
jgi:hypothetical protein